MGFDMDQGTLSVDLHAFASFPCYVDTLYDLARLACRECWGFRQKAAVTRYDGVEILAKYLEDIYRGHAQAYNAAGSRHEQSDSIHMNDRFALFHTGLFSREGNQAIYALFVNNATAGARIQWHFDAFAVEGDARFALINRMPFYPAMRFLPHEELFNPDWQVVIRFNTLLENELLIAQLPVRQWSPERFRLYMQHLVTSGKTMARRNAAHMAPVLCDGTLQFAMPLFLSDEEGAECALLLKPDLTRIYIGHEIVPIRTAYHMARRLGPVRAYWLTKLVSGMGGMLAQGTQGHAIAIWPDDKGLIFATTLRLPGKL